jgi:hypothetical protein
MTFERAPQTRDEARGLFAHTLTPDQRVTSPFYAALCDATADDDVLVDLLLMAPPSQRRPVLVFAALHEIALTIATEMLAPWYPTAKWLSACGGLDGPPLSPPPSSVGDLALGVAAVRDVASTHGDQLRRLLTTRSTQTNEVGRSGVLSFAQRLVANGTPFGLIDLGCSAGLNLLPDTYCIQASDGECLGDPLSGVMISPTWIEGSPLGTDWQIEWRCGIEITPLDLSRDADARWLLACQWPDDLHRFERTRRAIRQWRARPASPTILSGTALARLEEAVEMAPTKLPLIIQHSWVAAYLSHAEQAALAELVRQIGSSRPVHWLWLEHAREVPGFAPPHPTAGRIPGSSLLVSESIDDEPRVLAQVQPHGSWAAWEDLGGV